MNFGISSSEEMGRERLLAGEKKQERMFVAWIRFQLPTANDASDNNWSNFELIDKSEKLIKLRKYYFIFRYIFLNPRT